MTDLRDTRSAKQRQKGCFSGLKDLKFSKTSMFISGIAVMLVGGELFLKRELDSAAKRVGPMDQPTYVIQPDVTIQVPSIKDYLKRRSEDYKGYSQARVNFDVQLDARKQLLERVAHGGIFSSEDRIKLDEMGRQLESSISQREKFLSSQAPATNSLTSPSSVIEQARTAFRVITGKEFPSDGEIQYVDKINEGNDALGAARKITQHYSIKALQTSEQETAASLLHEMGHVSTGVTLCSLNKFPRLPRLHYLIDKDTALKEECMAYLFETVGSCLQPDVIKSTVASASNYYIARAQNELPTKHELAVATIHAWCEVNHRPHEIFMALLRGEKIPQVVRARMEKNFAESEQYLADVLRIQKELKAL